jgi:hypothetical protein
LEDLRMTGLLVLALFGLWIWAVFKLSRWIGGQVRGGRWRWPITALVFAALLPLPMLDELIARPQIEALCREGAVFKIDEQKIKGQRVKYSAEPSNADVPGTAVPVTYTKSVWRGDQTGEELASEVSYTVTGGVLVRGIGFSESNSPMFVRSGCAPAVNVYEEAKRLNFEIVN